METMKNKKTLTRGILLTMTAVGEIVLAIVLYDWDGKAAIINLGWVILWISAVFGCLPIFVFRKWGRVSKGKEYVHTTALVDRGIYALVRHPQYLSFMLIGLALPLIAQHWLVALLGAVVILLTYLVILDEEKSNIEKFGDAYRDYMQRVPRLNFLLGMARLVWRIARAHGKTRE